MNENETKEVIEIAEGVAARETAEAVTVNITGKALANLRELARIFSRWDGETKSAAGMTGEYLRYLSGISTLAEKKKPLAETTLAGEIVMLYENCEGAGDYRELRKMFENAGFSVNY